MSGDPIEHMVARSSDMTPVDEVNTGVNRETGLVCIEFLAGGELMFAAEVEPFELDRLIEQLQTTRMALGRVS